MEEGKNENDNDWNYMFGLLSKFAREKSPNISKYEVVKTPDGSIVRLGIWAYKQRELFTQAALREDYRNKLQELVDEGLFRWHIASVHADKKTKVWEENMKLMYQYVQEKGTANVPYDYVHEYDDGQIFRLGRWVTYQRRKRKYLISLTMRKKIH